LDDDRQWQERQAAFAAEQFDVFVTIDRNLILRHFVTVSMDGRAPGESRTV
jgi:hypothetical protein